MPMISLTLILLAFFTYLGSLLEIDPLKQQLTLNSLKTYLGTTNGPGNKYDHVESIGLESIREKLTKMGLQTGFYRTNSSSVLTLSQTLTDTFNETDTQIRASFIPILEELSLQPLNRKISISIVLSNDLIRKKNVEPFAADTLGLDYGLSLYRFFLDRDWESNSLSVHSNPKTNSQDVAEVTLEVTDFG
jgi:hypothetical protein